MVTETNTLRIVIDSRGALRNAEDLNRQLIEIQNRGDGASHSADGLSGSLKNLAVYMGGIVTIGSAINKMDTYTGLQNRLKLVTDSQTELNTAMSDTFAIAQKTASSWDATAMVYQRFADNADRLGITMSKTAELTETVSKAISVSGGSAASAEAALTQFGQALASGVLRGEEFNSIAEQAPGLLKAIARGLEVNVGELRAMAAEGKITGDVLVKALGDAKPYIDDLFNRTDFTIAQSFTKLSNEITKFVGEAGKGSGAASTLGSAIDLLSKNLGTIVDVAIVGGLALLTKSILSQTAATYSSIQASIQRKAVETSLLQTQVQIAALEVQRTRQVAALALTEVNLARTEFNSAQTRTARAAATMRLTQAEIALRIALNQTTAATVASTAAQNTLNASRAIGARMLGLVGGPIGAITIGVAALAAGYMYLKNQTAEANAKLEEQGKIADKTSEELKKLSGNDRISATDKLTESFDAQNKKIKESGEAVDAVLFAIRAASVENEKARKITEDAMSGVISYTDAIKLLNNEKISTDLYDKLTNQADQYDENVAKGLKYQKGLGNLGKVTQLTGNQAENASIQQKMLAASIDGVANSASGALSALDAFMKKSQASAKEAQWIADYAKRTGLSTDQAAFFYEAKTAGGGKPITQELANELDATYKQMQAVKNLDSARSEAAKRQAASIKSAASAQKKADREALKAQKDIIKSQDELNRLRSEIVIDYASNQKREELALEVEIQRLQKAGMTEYINLAKNRYNETKKLVDMQLAYDLAEFELSERQKLAYSFNIREQQIKADSGLTTKQREDKLKSLKIEFEYENSNRILAQKERMFAIEESLLSESDAIKKRYDLEIERINKIRDADERNHSLRMSQIKMQNEIQDRLVNAKNAVDANKTERTGGIGGFEGIEVARNEAVKNSDELLQAEILAGYENQEALYQAHVDRMAEIDANANKARLSLQLNYGEQITSSLASMFDSQAEKQSGAYKVMFAASKAFAIAQSLISIQSGIAQAAANPFPYNLAAMALVASSTASLVGNIKAIADVGFQTGGYTGNGGQSAIAGVVHGQEYVLNARATKNIGVDTLDAMNRGASVGGNVTVEPKIIINTPQGMSAEKSISQDGTVTIDVVDKHLTRSLSDPNSNLSKAIKQNLNVTQRR